MPTMSDKLFARPLAWEKKGLLITPQKHVWFMQSHAMSPIADLIGGDLYRVYFSSRDEKNRSHIGSAVIEVKQGQIKLISYDPAPAITLGDLGCFDDNGVTASSIVTVGSRKYFYYIGWNQGSTVRMHLFGGLALSDDGGKTFYRYSKAPIIERNRVNPLLNTAPFVIKDGHLWRMYYVAGIEWVHKDLPRYNIQYAESHDGLEWKREGHVCIDFASPQENALAKPFVLVEDGVYKMWFSYKGESYRLGYAESLDGKNWVRNDDFVGITVSESGWDSEMICFASVIKKDGWAYLLYNGNTYSKDGVGYAVARDEGKK